jgi:hypothetical protein
MTKTQNSKQVFNAVSLLVKWIAYSGHAQAVLVSGYWNLVFI